jgi:hypothetical protein
MLTYQKRLARHLSLYRRDYLGVTRCGIFRHRGIDKSYGHILPIDLRWLNIPEPFRHDIRNYVNQQSEFKLHRYFHHLNSSQAFALSMFYPYLILAKDELAAALGINPIDKWDFEKIPVSEEGTNVDVFLTSKNKITVYCEIKLSEEGFGKAAPDQRHQQKIKNIYRPRLDGKVDPLLLVTETFCSNYQILRNLWLAADDPRASVLFILPQENKVLVKELDRVFQHISPDIRNRTHVVFVENVIKKLAMSTVSKNNLAWYADILRKKYIPQV